MSKICRTCLQKCKRTFTTNQNLGVFGGEAVRISYVLRFCIPELYLGLSSNPEICYNCKESLKVTYLFKKKCLFTEQVIGNYLKNTRSTGKSVDLYDVLAYTDVQQCLSQEVDRVEQPVSPSSLVVSTNTEGILPDWNISNQLKPATGGDVEVRQSAPNPTNSKEVAIAPVPNSGENMKIVKFCEQTGLFVSVEKVDYSTGNMINKNLKSILQGQALNTLANNVTSIITPPATNSESDTICKITSVFSLSNEEENKSCEESAQPVTNKENEDNSVQIKNEPLDIDVSEECVGLNYVATDEDTLDASETASYQNLECDANLQGIIDNIPEINDANHYVDVPEFVQINNFGLKELEELRRQQQKQNDNADKNSPSRSEKNILTTEPPALISLNRETVHQDAVAKKDETVKNTDGNEKTTPGILSLTPVEQDHLRQNPNVKIVELGPEHFTKHFLFIDGKKYMKFKNEFRFIPESQDESDVIILKKLAVASPAGDKTSIFLERSAKPSIGLSTEDAVNQNNPKASESTVNITGTTEEIPAKNNDTAPIKPGRGRKKIKIVPVGDHKYAVLGSDVIKKNVHHIPVDGNSRSSSSDKDVVVLFTNFTMDGTYINDHDYLINPYKRNKVLIEEKDQWVCMCYICDKKHHTTEHVRHMAVHEPKCKICLVDLGTPYMLNVHVKSHYKPCRQCTQRVPYGQIESHEHSHYMDELEFEKEPKRKYAHLRARRRRAKRQLKPGYVPIMPAPVRLEKESDRDNSLDDLDDTPLSALVAVKFEEDARISEQPKVPKKRGRKRKSEIKVEDIPEEGDERSFRVLRSNVRKLYTESESEDEAQKTSDVVEDMSLIEFEDIPSGVGPP